MVKKPKLELGKLTVKGSSYVKATGDETDAKVK
jgi:hypothetical protein